MERPLLLPLLSIIAGLVTADFFLFFVPPPLPYVLLALSFPLLFFKKRFPFLILLALFFFSWGNVSLKPFLLHPHAPNDIVHFSPDREVTLEGIIDSRPEPDGAGWRIYLDCEKVYEQNGYYGVAGRVLLYVGEGRCELLTGDRVRFISKIKKPRNFGLPGEFDYVRYLAYRKVYATAYVPDTGDLVLVKRGAGHNLLSFTDRAAKRIGWFIGAEIPGEEGSIMKALLLGEKGTIPDKTREAYAKTGVSHILSISGFHVGIISIFVFYLMFYLARSSEFLLLHLNMRRLILIMTIPIIIFYLFLSGAAPATVRATIMVLAYVAAMVLDRETDPLNSLMLAAMVILVCSPPALFDVSFQLSFAALWGIIVLVPIFSSPFKAAAGTIRYRLAIFFVASVAAIFATFAPVAYYFHRVSYIGLVANLFVVPLVGYGAVIPGFLSLPFIFLFPEFAAFLLKAAAMSIKASNYITNHLALFPDIPPLNPSIAEMVLFYLFLACITFVSGKRSRVIVCCSIALVFLISLVASSISTGDENVLGITFFSVGQGESTLISFPEGGKMLVDGGGSLSDGGMDVGKRLLAPALWSKGVTRLDYVVLSHPHPDHLKGLLYILENFQVGEFWETGVHADSDECRELARILKEKHIPIRLMNSTVGPISIGDVFIEPLAPCRSVLAEAHDINDASLVFRLRYGDFSMLFSGDIGSATERFLSGTSGTLSCTVLKVAHHGSRFSSSEAFITAASPRIALVSAGYGNSFGLPSGRTLDVLGRHGAKIYRTDKDGTIEVFAGKNGCRVSTFIPHGQFN